MTSHVNEGLHITTIIQLIQFQVKIIPMYTISI